MQTKFKDFFEKPVDHLFASTIFLPYLRSLNLENLTIASPDMGGSKRAYAYSKFLESDVVICYKQREKANVISYMELIGDVKGKKRSVGGRYGRYRWNAHHGCRFDDGARRSERSCRLYARIAFRKCLRTY